ncbi:hypothetical protein CL645_04100 [bacterium]|nr:hypothetical protein [bacterium]|tara:strand:+ start:1484 stop:2167 length:684 start_codon:yes stop_codon:yes gene_type:complete
MIKLLFFIVFILGDSFSFQQKNDIEDWNLKIKDSKRMLLDYESQNDEINASTQRTFLSYSYSWLWFKYGDLESLKNLVIQNVQTLEKDKVYYGFSSSLNYEADLILLSDADSLISGKQLWLLNIHNQTKDIVENSLPYVNFHLKNGETIQRFLPQEDSDFLESQQRNNISRFLWDDNSLLPWYSKRLLILTEVINFDEISMLEVIFDRERILIPFWDNFLDFQDFKN